MHFLKIFSRVLCKFFARGACLKGEHCDFLHDSEDVPNNVCTYYQKGICAFGSRCRYEHVKITRSQPSLPSSSANIVELKRVNATDQSICSSSTAGNCPQGKKEEHMKTCETRENQHDLLKHSQEIECGVCLERVLSKTIMAERKFGILSECDHPFCISCIRNWRNSSPSIGMDVNSTLRACPICRKLSYFVIPSVIWYSTKEEKQEIINSYKAKLRSIDCKKFDFGNGTCPFGASCFYKHTVKPGSKLWNSTLMPDLHGSSFSDADETESGSDGDMESFRALFEEAMAFMMWLRDYDTSDDE
ncbi:putative RING-type E3 ubiquitin transferase C3H69 isoform X1 [Nicotiana tomentosiformis]|uniref:putative RING-type E3 ubiquitin transferase C3H69 isoform X1 n=1 Tax=Nicotiana tomentosiformis TaxID=4098 RepID=UPI00051B5BB0|nr:E3 ubiquitin-protein ligase makorin-like isoform X1 [Nicotiana tomentosiformis]